VASGGDAVLSHKNELREYIQQISRYPLLTPEEEVELATRYRESGDKDAFNRLICCNLRYVVRVACRHGYHGISVMDLIQEGTLGLYRATEKYDPKRGVRFLSYAGWWVRQRILGYITENLTEIKIGTTGDKRKAMASLKRALHQVDIDFGNLPHDERLALAADMLSISVEDAGEVLFRMKGETSLDQMISDDSTLGDVVADDQPTPEQLVEARCTPEYYMKLYELAFHWVLSKREGRVIRLRFLTHTPMTLDEIGQLPEFNFTRERSRQIEARAMRKLRLFFAVLDVDLDMKSAFSVKLKADETLVSRKKIVQLLRDKDPVVYQTFSEMDEFHQRLLLVRHLNGRQLSQRLTAQLLNVSLNRVVRSENKIFSELDRVILNNLLP